MRWLNTDLSYLGNALQKGVKVDGDLDNSEKILLPQLVSSGLNEGQQPLTTLPAVNVKKHLQNMFIDIPGSPLERSFRDMLLVDVSLVLVKVYINLEGIPATMSKVYSVDGHRLLIKHIIVGCKNKQGLYLVHLAVIQRHAIGRYITCASKSFLKFGKDTCCNV